MSDPWAVGTSVAAIMISLASIALTVMAERRRTRKIDRPV